MCVAASILSHNLQVCVRSRPPLLSELALHPLTHNQIQNWWEASKASDINQACEVVLEISYNRVKTTLRVHMEPGAFSVVLHMRLRIVVQIV